MPELSLKDGIGVEYPGNRGGAGAGYVEKVAAGRLGGNSVDNTTRLDGFDGKLRFEGA